MLNCQLLLNQFSSDLDENLSTHSSRIAEQFCRPRAARSRHLRKGNVKVEKDKSYATMDTLNAILINIKYFNRKMPLGKSSYNLSRRLYAKFEPNRMASFRDRLRSGQILWEVAKIYAEKNFRPLKRRTLL